MSIDYVDLGTWFADRPKWLQVAARRLFQTGGITAADQADLLVLCKREAGVAVSEKPDLVAVLIPASELRITGSGVPLRLTAISTDEAPVPSRGVGIRSTTRRWLVGMFQVRSAA